MRPASVCMFAAVGVLLACNDNTGPRGPKLAASYSIRSVDGKPLPASVIVRTQSTTTTFASNLVDGRFQIGPIVAWLLRTRGDNTTDPLFDVTGFAQWNQRIVGNDSVEFFDNGDPVALFFAGHFNDTLLVLFPASNASAQAPVNDVTAHAWTFHADTAIHP